MIDRENKISIIAHRGKTAMIKSENTIEAFQKAIDLGIPQIEFDLRMSQDGHLISYHDCSIDNIKISDLPYDRLQSIADKRGFQIPLFEDILKLCCNRISLDIEIKEEGYEEQIVSITTQYLDYSSFVMKSFNDGSIRKIKNLDPKIKVGLLLGGSIEGRFPVFAILSQFFPEYRIFKTGADFVAPNFRLLKFGFSWRMKKIDKEIYVWTVNQERQLLKLMQNKYITAIITDKPELALNLLDRL
jgi:glycerophosphoryl diester phosphodiesterase